MLADLHLFRLSQHDPQCYRWREGCQPKKQTGHPAQCAAPRTRISTAALGPDHGQSPLAPVTNPKKLRSALQDPPAPMKAVPFGVLSTRRIREHCS